MKLEQSALFERIPSPRGTLLDSISSSRNLEEFLRIKQICFVVNVSNEDLTKDQPFQTDQ